MKMLNYSILDHIYMWLTMNHVFSVSRYKRYKSSDTKFINNADVTLSKLEALKFQNAVIRNDTAKFTNIAILK